MIAALGCGAAHAQLLQGDGFTTDTSTGLEWLNLTTTAGINYNAILAGQGGFLADGWGVASAAQLNQLSADALGAPDTFHCNDSCDLGYPYEDDTSRITDPNKISLELALITDLGATASSNSDGLTTLSTRGYFSDYGPTPAPGNPFAGNAAFDLVLNGSDPTQSSGDWFAMSGLSQGAMKTDPAEDGLGNGGGVGNYGTFLVRAAPAADVPEPATWALFGVGLLGIALTRRRRTAP